MRKQVWVIIMEIINDLIVLKVGQRLHSRGTVPVRTADNDPVLFVDCTDHFKYTSNNLVPQRNGNPVRLVHDLIYDIITVVLIAFRKAHPVLRLTSAYEILSHVVPVHCANPHVTAFHIDGNVTGEPADEMYLVFSASNTTQTLSLPEGKWKLCISGERAGTTVLEVVENTLTIPPISAMVLVKGNTK